MARNEEKQLGKLNRLYLKKEKEEQALRNPKRPKLSNLNTADDIKQWLPSIKRDIDFNLKQSQVVCYSDDKITEYRDEVTKLEKEYKNFVRKIKQVDSSILNVPWTNRPYEPKNRCNNLSVTEHCHIPTPLLDNLDEIPPTNTTLWNCAVDKQDLPLEFNSKFEESITDSVRSKEKHKLKEFSMQSDTYEKLAKIFDIQSETNEEKSTLNDQQSFKSIYCVKNNENPKLDSGIQQGKGWFGLDYSSSDDES